AAQRGWRPDLAASPRRGRAQPCRASARSARTLPRRCRRRCISQRRRRRDVDSVRARCAADGWCVGISRGRGRFAEPLRPPAGGVWASADGGATWAPYGIGAPGAVADLAIVAHALYALAEGALYRCAGAGAHWERIESAPERGIALTGLAGKEPVLLLAQRGG